MKNEVKDPWEELAGDVLKAELSVDYELGGETLDEWQARIADAIRALPRPELPRPEGQLSRDLDERIAQITAHRGCHSAEHDPANGKLHGCCVVCGVPWPCEYAGTPPTPRESVNGELVKALRQAQGGCGALMWLGNNRHNFECVGASGLRLFDAAVADAKEAYHTAAAALKLAEEAGK